MSDLSRSENIIAGRLKQGLVPTLQDFGSIDDLLHESQEVAASPLGGEYIRILLAVALSENKENATKAAESIGKSLLFLTDDFATAEAVDALDKVGWVDQNVAKACFASLKSILTDVHQTPMCRAFALDGAFRASIYTQALGFELYAVLLQLDLTDDPEFLLRLTTILGVIYSQQRSEVFVLRLIELSSVSGVEAAAAFEIGLAKLLDGFEAKSEVDVRNAFHSSKFWFEKTLEYREEAPEAHLYITCLHVLIRFSERAKGEDLRFYTDTINARSFELAAYHYNEDEPAWLGARRFQSACWQQLACKLATLAERLDEPSWYEPALTIEQHILPIYTASRTMFRRTATGSLEGLVRPAIENGLLETKANAYVLRRWIEENGSHDSREVAQELYDRLEKIITDGATAPPTTAATDWSPVAALLNMTSLSSGEKVRLIPLFSDVLRLQLSNIDSTTTAVIETCLSSVENHPDFKFSMELRQLYGAVLMSSIQFLSSRLSGTAHHYPHFKYLFESRDGRMPTESDLHHDYVQFLSGFWLGTNIEVSDVGGGRADVQFRLGPESLVCEVKREESDASFSNLEAVYLEQTVAYQVRSARLGFLLVLDLTDEAKGMAKHISELVKPTEYLRVGETQPRHCLILKVPGRKQLPSALTAAAVSAKPKKQRNSGKLPG